MRRRVVIIGAGPAGLTAAYQLTKAGIEVEVLEADPRHVGGIARTEEFNGFHFDVGGHRFFSKSKEVEDLWTEILPNDLLTRRRLSRIFYEGKFFSYPLRPFEALWKLGPKEALLCVASYLKAKLFPLRQPRSCQDWVISRFGSRLFRRFFKTYTEKVWGMDCREISADWAAQRIQGLSLRSALTQSVRWFRPVRGARTLKTLIDQFRYPRKGPGMLWRACAEKVRRQGGSVRLGCRVTGCHFDLSTETWSVHYSSPDGTVGTASGTDVVSSAPLREFALGLSPPLSQQGRQAAQALRYRDFLTVALILRGPRSFRDNWIYVHDPLVKVGRIQNFGAWSPEMLPDDKHSCLGLEYFCFEGDGLWARSDSELIQLACEEICRIGLAHPEEILEGSVVRQPKAYPVYDDQYAAHLGTLREELERRYPGLHLVGRNGLHKYNNQDHAMMTALLTAENIRLGRREYDVWRVNEDAAYLEEGEAKGSSGLRQIPHRLPQHSA